MVIALGHLLDHPSLATHPTRTESQRSRMVGSGTGSRMINIVIAKLVTLNSKRILSRLHGDRRWRRQYAREVLTTRITMVKERKPVPCCGSRETFVRPRYHQGPWWVQVRESLGPEDDAFRSGHRNREDHDDGTVVSDDPVALDVACPPRPATAFINSLIRFRFGRRAATTDTVIIFISTALTVVLLRGENHRPMVWTSIHWREFDATKGSDEFSACLRSSLSFCRLFSAFFSSLFLSFSVDDVSREYRRDFGGIRRYTDGVKA